MHFSLAKQGLKKCSSQRLLRLLFFALKKSLREKCPNMEFFLALIFLYSDSILTP